MCRHCEDLLLCCSVVVHALTPAGCSALTVSFLMVLGVRIGEDVVSYYYWRGTEYDFLADRRRRGEVWMLDGCMDGGMQYKSSLPRD